VIDRDDERIDMAAVLHADGTLYAVPRPGRHHTVIRIMNTLGVWGPNGSRHEQGFVTSHGRFVRRVAAKRIAVLAGQVVPGSLDMRELFSENVW
jgi:hypothetical protein